MPPLEITEVDVEEEEATASIAAAQRISMDATVKAVLSNWKAFFKRTQRQLKAFLGG